MGARGKNFYNELVCEYGFEEAAEQIQELFLDGKQRDAAAAVPDELVDELALVGPQERIADRLAAWRESGATTMLVSTRDASDAARRRGGAVSVTALRPRRQDRDRHRRRHRDRAPDGRRASPRRAPTSSSARARPSAASRRRPSWSSSACARSASAATCATPSRCARSSRRPSAELGGVDVLVNNAGTVWGASPEDMPLEGWQKVIDVNLTGVFLFAQAAGRVMIERGGGAIVNIASVAGPAGRAARRS